MNFILNMKLRSTGLFTLSLLLSVNVMAQQPAPQQIYLWQQGAPGFENRKDEPEQAKDWWVRNIHNPSITAFIPEKGKANGTAVVICPGGGHRNLVYNAEGRDAALFFNSLGITAFVLKYRLFREEGSPYVFDKDIKMDAYRAMRLVRSRAKEWDIDTTRVGMMGFSAGGEVVSLIAYDAHARDIKAKDPVDRLNGRPDFQILIYPGPLGIPETVSANAPPAFLLAANNDECCSEPLLKLTNAYRRAKASVELHLYSVDKHAFNMGNRSTYASIKGWPQRLADWLSDNGYLNNSNDRSH
jgi:acetyl esterase/lipase